MSGAVTYPGWVKQTMGTGPVVSIAVANDGASYANLAVGTVSNGTANPQVHLGVNSTGHVQSITVDNGGNGFINTAAIVVTRPANGVATFTIGGGSGYANGEVVTVSNGQINATGSITTNATGGITGITLVAPFYAGRGFAAANSTASPAAITTANGTNGNVVVATIGAGGTSLSSTVTLGGRSSRVQYETLVASDSIAVTANNNWFQA